MHDTIVAEVGVLGKSSISSANISSANVRLSVALFLVTLVAHAVAYLLHEYAHSISAWAFGWMNSPFGIDYGPRTVYNAIFLGDVSDNVDYDSIFSKGHGWEAAFIALAGAFLGNVAVYFLCYLAVFLFRPAMPRWLVIGVYCLALMSAANVWSYVPIRAITTHADMAIAAKGLGISPLVLFPFLAVPAFYIVHHFHTKMLPVAGKIIADGSRVNMALLIVVTSFWYFSFFGGDGIDGSYGGISQLLSIVSRYFLFPFSAMYFLGKYCLVASPTGDEE